MSRSWGATLGAILGAAFALFGSAMKCKADEGTLTVYVGGGHFTSLGGVGELAVQVDTRWSWLKPEVEILGTGKGVIVGVTPYISFGRDWFVQAGIGVADNTVNLPDHQAQGLIFHLSACAGHTWGQNSIKACGDHYSNGFSLGIPVIGREPNAGFNGFVVMYGRSW
jgi:hypothetical protein